MSRSPSRAIVVACALLVPATTSAQLIQIKTVPVAQGDQFDIFPSRNWAMGGVSIALRDQLLDPFGAGRFAGLALETTVPGDYFSGYAH
jgi:hypothetical protein